MISIKLHGGFLNDPAATVWGAKVAGEIKSESLAWEGFEVGRLCLRLATSYYALGCTLPVEIHSLLDRGLSGIWRVVREIIGHVQGAVVAGAPKWLVGRPAL